MFPGERFAVDGIIRAGKAEIDEQMITGESRTVDQASRATPSTAARSTRRRFADRGHRGRRRRKPFRGCSIWCASRGANAAIISDWPIASRRGSCRPWRSSRSRDRLVARAARRRRRRHPGRLGRRADRLPVCVGPRHADGRVDRAGPRRPEPGAVPQRPIAGAARATCETVLFDKTGTLTSGETRRCLRL